MPQREGIGLGVASSFPAAITLPAEMGIFMSARMLMTLQLCASFGEMLCPFVMGITFQFRAYQLFYILLFAWQGTRIPRHACAYMAATRVRTRSLRIE